MAKPNNISEICVVDYSFIVCNNIYQQIINLLLLTPLYLISFTFSALLTLLYLLSSTYSAILIRTTYSALLPSTPLYFFILTSLYSVPLFFPPVRLCFASALPLLRLCPAYARPLLRLCSTSALPLLCLCSMLHKEGFEVTLFVLLM